MHRNPQHTTARPVHAHEAHANPAGWMGMHNVAHPGAGGADAPVDARGTADARASTTVPRARSAFVRFVVDFVRSGVIGLSLITAVPLVHIASRDGLRLFDRMNAAERIADVERLRPFMVPRDAATSADEAGRAFNALRAPRSRTSAAVNAMLSNEDFPMHPVTAIYERPWQTQQKTIGMFPAPRTQGLDALTASQVVLRASGGFTPDEMTYLRNVADAPIWREVERVASAPQVDMVGGQFVLPFSDKAFSPAMPITRFADSKALAYAGVSRAAYYLALGDPARAEAALKTVVSFGFMFIDNGSNVMDALIGRVIIDIGRDGLHQLYEVTGNARGLELTAPLPKRATQGGVQATSRAQSDAILARRTSEANDTRLPRTVRYERLQELAFSSCGSVREVLTGPRDAVRESFARASDNLARFPSERAYLELMLEAPNRGQRFGTTDGKVDALIAGAATVAATVLQNQRIATCTQLLLALD